MICIDPLVTGYERGTFEERSARTESSPRQSRKNSEDDSRANNNIGETLGILSDFLTLSPAEYTDLHGAPFQTPEEPPMDPTPPPGANDSTPTRGQRTSSCEPPNATCATSSSPPLTTSTGDDYATSAVGTTCAASKTCRTT